MIPMLAHLRITTPRRRLHLVGIPLILIWLLLLPLILLLLPFLFIACWIAHVNPFRLIAAAWNLFAGLKGTQVEFAENGESVQLQIV